MNFIVVATVFSIVALAAIHDARTGFIPDRVSLGGFALLCGIALANGTLLITLIGAAVAGGSLAFLHIITRGRGLGLGDVKLALAIGAALGPTLGLVALGLAFIFGASIAIILLLLRRVERGHEMYFAPYLAAGTMVATLVHAERFI